MSRKEVVLPLRGHSVVFHHRDAMKMRAVGQQSALAAVPATPLPVDGTGNMGVSVPMDGNDTLGICGPAMAAHSDNIFTYRQGSGTESVFDLTALESQYERVSGGDNGTSEDDVVNRIWKVGIAGNTKAVIQDSLDIDVLNVPLAQYAIDQFYVVLMAWSVPDVFLNTFNTGVVFTGTGVPDPNNGHFTPLADLDASGNMRIVTWGTWCWASPSYISSVDPQCFIVFSSRQFDPATGLDSKGRHVTEQGQKWVELGGSASVVASVVSMFPAVGPSPTPIPVPTPTPVPPQPPVNPPTPITFPSYSGTLDKRTGIISLHPVASGLNMTSVSYITLILDGLQIFESLGNPVAEQAAITKFLADLGVVVPFTRVSGITVGSIWQLLMDGEALFVAIRSGDQTAEASAIAKLEADLGITLSTTE